MNILEWLGVIFLSIIVINIVVGIWALITALGSDEDSEVYSRR